MPLKRIILDPPYLSHTKNGGTSPAAQLTLHRTREVCLEGAESASVLREIEDGEDDVLEHVMEQATGTQQVREVLLAGVPGGLPVGHDAGAEASRPNFLTHTVTL